MIRSIRTVTSAPGAVVVALGVLLCAVELTGKGGRHQSPAAASTGTDLATATSSPAERLALAPALEQEGRGAFALADRRFASFIDLPASLQHEAASIVSRLDAETVVYARAELDRWRKEGGSTVRPAPDFRSPSSPEYRHVARMRHAARKRLLELLDDDQKRRLVEALIRTSPVPVPAEVPSSSITAPQTGT